MSSVDWKEPAQEEDKSNILSPTLSTRTITSYDSLGENSDTLDLGLEEEEGVDVANANAAGLNDSEFENENPIEVRTTSAHNATQTVTVGGNSPAEISKKLPSSFSKVSSSSSLANLRSPKGSGPNCVTRARKQVFWQKTPHTSNDHIVVEGIYKARDARRLRSTVQLSASVPSDAVVFQVLKKKKIGVSLRLLALSKNERCLMVAGDRNQSKSIPLSRVSRMDKENAKLPFSKLISVSSLTKEKEYAWPLNVYISAIRVGKMVSLSSRTFLFKSCDERRYFIDIVHSINHHDCLPPLFSDSSSGDGVGSDFYTKDAYRGSTSGDGAGTSSNSNSPTFTACDGADDANPTSLAINDKSHGHNFSSDSIIDTELKEKQAHRTFGTGQKKRVFKHDNVELYDADAGAKAAAFQDMSCHLNPLPILSERVLFKEKGVSFLFPVDAGKEWQQVSGTMWVTNFRLFFAMYRNALSVHDEELFGDIVLAQWGAGLGFNHVPLHAIHNVVTDFPSLVVQTSDMRTLRFAFDRSSHWLENFKAQIARWQTHTFALNHCPNSGTVMDVDSRKPEDDGWGLCYDPQEEFEKMRAAFIKSQLESQLQHHPDCAENLSSIESNSNTNNCTGSDRSNSHADLRLLDQTTKYAICKSYPRFIALPASFTDEKISQAAKYRSRKRLPAIRWVHPVHGSVLCRSSQPMAGLVNHRSALDEELLNCYTASSRAKRLFIIDARGRPAVFGNRLQGKGLEKADFYNNATIEMCSIGNIHTMRTSMISLAAALDKGGAARGDHAHPLQSSWYDHLSAILSAGVRVATILEKHESSVLVHCSDGFDRTPQIICIAKILVDPSFRTLRGFCQLVEAEWCSFGHMFAARYKDRGSQEFSPIFLQFLEAVFNLIQPRQVLFEITEDLLLFLAKHLYSGRFGSFLYNTEMERQSASARENTLSIWTEVFKDEHGLFTNKEFTPFEHPIWPNSDIKSLQIWRRFWFKDKPYLLPLKMKSYHTDAVATTVQ